VPDSWIETNETVQGGTPVIRGTRITVYSVLARIEGDETLETLVANNPDVPREAFEAAISFARAHPPGRAQSFAAALEHEGFVPTGTSQKVEREREAPRPELWTVEAAVRKNRMREGFVGYLEAFPGEDAPRNCKPSRDVEL
jgi:uncharacterized protein (DUF433 family)